MNWDTTRLARAGLAAVLDPGDETMSALIGQFGPVGLWDRLVAGHGRPAWVNRARALDVRQLVDLADRHGLDFITPEDAEWPAPLDDLADCAPVGGMRGIPVGLWTRGPAAMAGLLDPAIAIVGARACTSYGDTVAKELACDLARSGWTVVSGGALGIDAAAHVGALAGGGATVLVSGGGLDEPYPRTHGPLFDRVAASHLVVSEVPPGRRPTRAGFLARNRLIAAMACATVVVEAAARSGAKNTVSWADTLSRQVLAVPGPVHSSLSVSTNRLIRDHQAQLITDAADVLAVLAPIGSTPEPEVRGGPRLLDQLTPVQSRVRECLPGRRAIDLDEISVRSGLSAQVCSVALGELEDLGLVEADGLLNWRPVRSDRGGRS